MARPSAGLHHLAAADQRSLEGLAASAIAITPDFAAASGRGTSAVMSHQLLAGLVSCFAAIALASSSGISVGRGVVPSACGARLARRAGDVRRSGAQLLRGDSACPGLCSYPARDIPAGAWRRIDIPAVR